MRLQQAHPLGQANNDGRGIGGASLGAAVGYLESRKLAQERGPRVTACCGESELMGHGLMNGDSDSVLR
jgi:hypothetical protein